MGWLQAFVLGVTQGITEFLPISSDGHLILMPALFGWRRFGLGFDVVLHAGTLLATVLYFRHDVLTLLRAAVSRAAEDAREKRLAWLIVWATIPSVVVALAFESAVDGVESLPMDTQVLIVGAFLLLTASSLGGAELLGRRWKAHTHTAEDVPLWKALLVGLAQGFAVAPGLSRSGTTIATGVALGLDRGEAARFSFLLSIPIIFAATSKKVLIDVVLEGGSLPGPVPLVVGLVTTTVVGYAAIAFLLPYVRRHTLWVFALYTALAGSAILLANLAS